MPPQPTLVCLGDCCIDAYLPPIGRGFAGGSAANAAVAASAGGLSSACAGSVGSDPAGEAVIRLLAGRNVDTSHLIPHPGPTRRVPIRITPQGHQFDHELMPPRRPFQPSNEMLAFARRVAMVHLNWLDDPLQAVPTLSAPGGPRLALDYGQHSPAALLDATLPAVEVAFFALPAGRAAEAEALASAAGARGPRLVIVTLGEAGSLAWDGGPFARHPARTLAGSRLVDSLGAGDAFIGAFLAVYLHGKGLEDCLAAATDSAAITCADFGGWPGAEIDPALLQTQEDDRP
jgi:fructoselysine 6-kinase